MAWTLLYVIPALITASLTASPTYCSRWRSVGEHLWRIGTLRGECWIGVRYSFELDAIQVAILPGLVLMWGHG